MQHAEAVDAGFLHYRRGHGVGQQARQLVRELAQRCAVGLHPDSIDHRIGASADRQLAERGSNVVVFGGVDGMNAVAMRHLEPLWHEVDPEDLRGVLMKGDPG